MMFFSLNKVKNGPKRPYNGPKRVKNAQSAKPRSSLIRWKDKSEVTPIVGLANPECSDRISKSLD